MKLFYSIIFLFSIIIIPVWAAVPEPNRRTFVLAEGSFQIEGIPGFGPNRIPALFGRYVTPGDADISVWAVNEPLVFDTALWGKKAYGEMAPVYVRISGEKRIVALPRMVLMQDALKDYGRWYFVFSIDKRRDETYCRLFIMEFIGRAERFFSLSRLLTDLSFPATMEVTGKP
jgi:hypothetical protein